MLNYIEMYLALPIMICAVNILSSRCLNRISAIHASRDKVVTSPREAAIGVATLSGFTFKALQIRESVGLEVSDLWMSPYLSQLKSSK